MGLGDGFKVGVELGKVLGTGLGFAEEVGFEDTVGSAVVGVNDGCFVGEAVINDTELSPVILIVGCGEDRLLGAGEEEVAPVVGIIVELFEEVPFVIGTIVGAFVSEGSKVVV
jgi:hypothetical protein